LEPMPLATLPDEVAKAFAERDFVHTNFYRTISHNQELTRAWAEFAFRLRDESRTPRSLRELLILRSAMLHHAPYAWHHHRAMAKSAGVTDDQVAELAMWETSEAFSPEERCALALVDTVATHGDLSKARQAMTPQFDPQEQVELIITAAFYEAVTTVATIMGVRPEDR
jgi:4-carboxymuconolactone decarboxylase